MAEIGLGSRCFRLCANLISPGFGFVICGHPAIFYFTYNGSQKFPCGLNDVHSGVLEKSVSFSFYFFRFADQPTFICLGKVTILWVKAVYLVPPFLNSQKFTQARSVIRKPFLHYSLCFESFHQGFHTDSVIGHSNVVPLCSAFLQIKFHAFPREQACCFLVRDH